MTVEDDPKLALLRETLEANADFTTYETEVYLALVRGGTQTMTEIAKTSNVPKQRVYDLVDELQGRGFVEVIDDYPRKAYAVDPTEALTSIRDRLSKAEDYLEELHDTVDTVESGVALFKSESTIRRYIDDLLQTAERDVLMLLPVGQLSKVAESLEGCEAQQVRLVLSNVAPETDDMDAVSQTIPDTVDEVRAVTTREDFVLTIDRRRGLYWEQVGNRHTDTEGHGYYVTNQSLAMVLDRFVSESIWPVSRQKFGEPDRPSLPKQYLRIRDCLSDLSTLTESQPVDDFEVEFEGYDTETEESVTKQGTLTSYYFTEYDVRSSLTLNIAGATEDVTSPLITVGDAGTRNVDYAAQQIELREIDSDRSSEIDAETQRHLNACRSQLPPEFGDASVVVGFDAFVDRMREFIELRPEGAYEPIRGFDSFRESLVRFEASETAPRLEWRQTRTEPGGIVAHVGSAFDTLGYDVSLIGPLGDPIRPEFTRRFRDQTIVSLGRTTSTDYVWFDDRKFLLTEPNVDAPDWEGIKDRVGLSQLANHIDDTDLLTIGTWYATPTLPDIVRGLGEELWPLLNEPPSHVHVQPGEISHLSAGEIDRGAAAFATLDQLVPVTVTANRNQTRGFRDAFQTGSGRETAPTVEQIRDRLDITRYVMHTPRGATLASPDDVLSARAPPVVNPRQVHNVDEHFISGMALALAEGLSDGAALVLANSVASYFMRHEKEPESRELRSFVTEYDAFFDEA